MANDDEWVDVPDDSSNWVDAPGDVSIGDALMRTLNYIPTSAGRIVAGIGGLGGEAMGKVGEYFGSDWLQNEAEIIDRGAQISRDWANTSDEEARQKYGAGQIAEPGSKAYYLEQLGPLVTQLAPMLLAGPLGGATIAGLEGVGQEYSSLADKGEEDYKIPTALGVGALNALTSKFELGKTLKPGMSALGRAVLGAKGEALQNVAADIGTKGLEEALTNQDYTLGDYGQGIKDNAILGAGSGAITHGALNPYIEWAARRSASKGTNSDFSNANANTTDILTPETLVVPMAEPSSSITIPEVQLNRRDAFMDAQQALIDSQKLTPVALPENQVTRRNADMDARQALIDSQKPIPVDLSTDRGTRIDNYMDAQQAIIDSQNLITKAKKSDKITISDGDTFTKPLQETIQEGKQAEVTTEIQPKKKEEIQSVEIKPVDADFSEKPTSIGLDYYRLFAQNPDIEKVNAQSSDYLIPKELVGANPELFQFKAFTDKKTGVSKQLEGKYDPEAAKGMFFYEPIDPTDPKWGLAPGKILSVVNGHHRLHLANRSPEAKYLHGSIMKEADGFSVQDANIRGAELNIIDGKGTTLDQAKYFRGISRMGGPVLARKRGTELGTKSGNGQIIGIESSDELFHSFATGKTPEPIAKAIAETSRKVGEGNRSLQESIQSIALQAYRASLLPDRNKKITPLTPIEVAQVAHNYANDIKESVQGDLFNFTKPSAKQLAIDTAKAKLMAQDRERLNKELSGIKRDENLNNISQEERARLLADGQDISKITDPESVKAKRKDIELKLTQLDKIRAFPDINAEYIKKAEKVVKKTGYQSDLLSDETGSAPILMEPGRFASKEAKKIGEAVASLVDAWKIKVDQSPIDKQFGTTLGRAKKQFSTMAEVAREHPTETPIVNTYAAAKNMAQRKSEILHDSSSKLARFALLSPEEKVRAQDIVHGIRRESDARITKAKESGNINDAVLNIDQQDLIRRGLSEEGAQAVMDVYDYMHNDAIQYLQEGLIARADAIIYDTKPSQRIFDAAKAGDEKAKAAVSRWNASRNKLYQEAVNNAQGLKEWNGVRRWYIPFNREGDFYVHAIGPDGETKAFHLTDGSTNAVGRALGANKEIAALKKEYEAKGYTVEYGKRKKTQQSAYDDLPNSIRGKISIGGDSELDPIGFNKHLQEAKLTEGESKNIESAITDYVYGLANFASKNRARLEFKKALDTAGDKASYRDWLSASQQEYLGGSAKKTRAFEELVTLYNLGLKMSLPVQSLTQMLTTTTAKIGTKNSLKASGLASKYYTSEDFAKNHPKLAEYLNSMKREGALEANAFGEWRGDNSLLNKTVGYSLKPFLAAEQFTKTHAAIGAFYDAIDKKIPPEKIYQYMKDITKETQFGNANIDRPLIATSSGALGEAGSLAMMYRNWGMNYWRFLRNNWKGGDKAVAAKSLAYTFGLAGLTGLPFAKSVLHYAASEGYDPQKELRDLAGDKVATFALYGATPYITEKLGLSINMSGSLGLGGMVPEFGDNPLWNTAKFVGGAPMAFIENMTTKPYKSYMDGNPIVPTTENPRSAVESMLPEFIRRPAVAIREAREGWRNPDGTPVGHADNFGPHNPTLGEGIAYGLGFMPAEKVKRYEEQQSIWAAQKRDRGVSGNDKVAELLFDLRTGKVSRETVREFILNYNKEQMKLPPEKRKELNEGAIRNALLKRMGVPVTAPKSSRKDIIELRNTYKD